MGVLQLFPIDQQQSQSQESVQGFKFFPSAVVRSDSLSKCNQVSNMDSKDDHSFPTLSNEKVRQLRLSALFRPLSTATLCDQLKEVFVNIYAIQAQESLPTLLALWNRLPRPRPSQNVLTELCHHGSSAAGLTRICAFRGTQHMLQASEFCTVAAALYPFIKQKRNNLHDRQNHTTDFEKAMEAAKSQIANNKSIDNLKCSVVDTSVKMLLTLGGYAERLFLNGKQPYVPVSYERCFSHIQSDNALLGCVCRYFASYGPATEADLAYFFGLPRNQCKRAVRTLLQRKTLLPIKTENGIMLMEQATIERLQNDNTTQGKDVLFLGRFDPALLAHADKSWLVSEAIKPQIWWRPGEVSASVVVHGKVKGYWRIKGQKEIQVTLLAEPGSEEFTSSDIGLVYDRGHELIDHFFQKKMDLTVFLATCAGQRVELDEGYVRLGEWSLSKERRCHN